MRILIVAITFLFVSCSQGSDGSSNSISLWLPFFGMVLGSLITGLIAFGINYTNKKSEERKHLNTLVMNAAIENWKQVCEIGKLHESAEIQPLDAFIIHMIQIQKTFIDQDISKQNVASKLKQITEITDEVTKYHKNKSAS